MMDKLENHIASIILYGSIIATLAFFYVPIATLVVFSFKEGRYLSMPIEGWTLDWYRALFNNRDIGAALANSVIVAVCATAASTLIGLGAAQAWVRYRFRGKTLFQAIGIGPLLFPQLLLAVIILFWFTVLSKWFGFSNGIVTATIGHVVYLTPFATIIIAVQAAGLDPAIEHAAQDCGASNWEVFREVTLPLSLPGLAAGLLLCFVLAAGSYVTPQLLGSGRDALFGNLIYDTIMGELNWPMGATLSIVLFVVLGFFAAIYTRYMGMSQIVKGLGG